MIEKLTIQRESEDNIGLFGITDTGSEIINVVLKDVSIAGKSMVGGLIGTNMGSVSDCSISGAITGSTNRVGGLAGENSGKWLIIDNVGLYGEILKSNVAVTVNGNTEVGGIVGRNIGQISQSHVTGQVTGGNLTGGFTGINYSDRLFTGLKGQISYSTSTADVIGNGRVGGLAGSNEGQILKSKASGNVSGQGCVGGLIGETSAQGVHDIYPRVLYSLATGNVTGISSVGGLAGCFGAYIRDSYATGNASGESDVGGFIGLTWGVVTGKMNPFDLSHSDFQSISGIHTSYSTGLVTGVENVGGFAGFNEWTVIESYWDIESSEKKMGSGAGISDGIFGLTTEQMTGQNAFTHMYELDFVNTWQLTEGYPVLAWQDPEDAIDPPEVPIIRVDIAMRDFGLVSTDKSKTLEVPIRNTGNNMLNGEVQIAGPDAGWFAIADGLSTFSLEVGGSQAVEITFSPEGMENYEAELYVVHDAPNRSDTLVISLVGQGKEPTDATPEPDLPGELALHQNYPNPFNPVTVIPFSLPEQSHVRLVVFDLLGRQVDVLTDRAYEAGHHQVTWDGSRAAGGLYIVRMMAGDHTRSRQMMLMK